MKKHPIVINGQFTARRMTGQERFAYEIVSELDKICNKDEFELVVPRNAVHIPNLTNIRVVKYGKAPGSLWEQTFLALYLLTKRRMSLNLCSIMPLLKPGYICIHDLSYKVNPQYFNTLYAKISQLWHKIQYQWAFKLSPLIFTVSEYSKKQMIDIYNVSAKRILVIENGWEHFARIQEDESLLKRKRDWFSKPYFFSLGSLAPNKNINWILKVSQKHPDYNFLIAGNANLRAYGSDYSDNDYSNVKFLGYLSDGEVKTLMKKCKAFIFPSFFEGFGIPPLEALAVDAKIIIANASCLPEIFGKSAYYIDPTNTDVDLAQLLESTSVESAEAILDKYTYANAGRKVYNVLNKLIES